MFKCTTLLNRKTFENPKIEDNSKLRGIQMKYLTADYYKNQPRDSKQESILKFTGTGTCTHSSLTESIRAKEVQEAFKALNKSRIRRQEKMKWHNRWIIKTRNADTRQ